MNSWILQKNTYCAQTHLHDAPVNTLGNGLIGCRGFFEEQQEGIAALGGIYMSGVYGKADYIPWSGKGRELVNVPNFFWAHIAINGAPLVINEENLQHFSTELDLQNATLTRSYTYCEHGKELVRFTFFRFIGRADIYTCGQRIEVTPLQENLTVTVLCGINTNITNLNLVSSEPYPVQPGRRQYRDILHTADLAMVKIEEPDEITLGFGQTTHCSLCEPQLTPKGHLYTLCAAKDTLVTIEKLVALSLSVQDGESTEQAVRERLAKLPSFSQALAAHCAEMHRRWQDADITLEGNESDQLTLRYNLLQLMQACPEHTERSSIGARGLTGEMYEGSIFWDTEIFMVPFFTMTHPDAARKLLMYRYHTLPQARAHAQSNWFEGAMYGWQVNERGEEQTPKGVGAYYSIHVIADIAYIIQDYWLATGDEAFMLAHGMEILIETARFWASRATKRDDGQYDIMAVRGPNEYDVLVNNNLYTNMMARENFLLCAELLQAMQAAHPEALHTLLEKLCFTAEEQQTWADIAKALVLPFAADKNLWLEDDAYLRRKAVDMRKAKPTPKRIIDTTIPYEALPFYQFSKQADVLHVMKNLPWYFTQEQMHTAYDFYQPRTAFDSSLSYSMFALMAARLGREEEAAAYFEKTANLDIKNVQLNTISGLHFANFGGTWQTAVFGFGGVSVEKDCIGLCPHLPHRWDKLSFRLHYRGAQLAFTITAKDAIIEMLQSGGLPVTVRGTGKTAVLQTVGDSAHFSLGEERGAE